MFTARQGEDSETSSMNTAHDLYFLKTKIYGLSRDCTGHIDRPW